MGIKKLFEQQKFIILDGAMGTMLQKYNLPVDVLPESLNVTHPEWIVDIHKEYIAAGAQVIYTNTFGANRLKCKNSGYTVEEIVVAAVNNAKKAIKNTNSLVALDIGPIGQLLQPLGTLSFEDAYSIIKEQVVVGDKAGVDCICVETIADLAEARIAVLAAKENSSLPVICTMTFEENMRTFTGCSVASAAITLTGLGVDALGINCSLGPKEIFPIAKELCRWTNLPILIKPNAGLPDPSTGEYSITAEEYAEELAKIANLGVQLIGGCCGTSPLFIKELHKVLSSATFEKNIMELNETSTICSAQKALIIDELTVVGERINPTGKMLFQEALLKENIDYVLSQGIQQVTAGANILDVNVGLPEIDEKAMMVKVITALQSTLDVPLQIDSTNPEVIEAALRIYNGKAIVNSVNGDDETLNEILPIAKKYGAAIIGLTLDKNGIPETAEQRFTIARKIIDKALGFGIALHDIYIDCLTLTASAEQENVMQTIEALQMVKNKLGVKTILGVSNISFGLPNRELINQTFLTMAAGAGLDLAIINPNVVSIMDAVSASKLLLNQDIQSRNFITKYTEKKNIKAVPLRDITLEYAVRNGLSKEAGDLTYTLLQNLNPMEIVNGILIPALDEVGMLYEKGEIFLPQLIQSATAAQSAFAEIKKYMQKNDKQTITKGNIVIATVKGDIHDIGKNIVKVLLENYGFGVIDLGKDVAPEAVVAAAQKYQAELIGLSALMTTTLKNMQETIEALKAAKLNCKVMVGGAVLTSEYAKAIGADYYVKDAKDSVDVARKVI